MRDLDREIEVLSGNAERRLEQERLQILNDRQQTREGRLARRHLLTQMEVGKCGRLLPTVAAMTKHELRSYDPARLVRSIMQPKPERCLEIEVSESVAQDVKAVPQHGGHYVPWSILALDTKTDAAGAYLSERRIGDIAPALRPHAMTLQLGAQFWTGINLYGVPFEVNVLSSSWMDENPADPNSDSDSSFGSFFLNPHPMQASTSFSRQLISQATPDVTAFVVSCIAKAHAQLIDKAVLHGSGSQCQPVGIANRANVVSTGANGAAVTSDHINSLESLVAAGNGDVGALAFLTNSGQRSKLRKIPSMTSGVIPPWDGDRMLGYPAVASNQVRADLAKGSGSNLSALFFGNWNQVIIAEGSGALELAYDQYSQKKRAMIDLCSYASYDVALLTPGSFACILDAV